MNTAPALGFSATLRPFLFLLLLTVLPGSLGVLEAASLPVPLRVEAGGRTAVLSVPAGCTSVSIERLVQRKWVPFRTVGVTNSSATLRVELAPGTPVSGWRALGQISGPVRSVKKYPAAFYSGAHVFGSAMAPDSEASASAPVFATGVAYASAMTAAAVTTKSDASTTTLPEESDIWKADGSTVYFFNQLRGLQVVDLSDPAKPELTASLRLPATGQDLYVVPGAAGARLAVLLTKEYDRTNWRSRTGIKVVKVAGGTAEIVAETTLDGWMVDSRLVGSRLYVVTQDWAASNGTVTLHEVTTDTATVSATHALSGYSPVVSAGEGWLAIAVQPPNDWTVSLVSLFALGNDGVQPVGSAPIAVAGRVYDKFKMQYSGGTLSVISQKWVSDGQNWWRGTPVSVLEIFTGEGEKLAELEIMRGEQLYATRFAGNKAYAVTFRQVDPLWVIDLADPKAPVIAGHLEVPGWSTYIEPVGDLLFSIGFDGGKVAASLFDVSDPAHPSLLDRELMKGAWGYSEATYDEKALKVLAAEGLVLIPYTGTGKDGSTEHFVQLLDLDVKAGELRQRGVIIHDFQPRRAAMIEGTLASISQKQLITADVTDRDAPAVLADLLLAWPADHLVAAGDYLIEISDGNSWAGEAPMAVVATGKDPEAALGEVALGDGVVKDALLRDGRLYVLRQTPADTGYYWYRPMMPVLLDSAGGSPSSSGSVRALHLDVYDASALPSMPLLGTASAALPDNISSFETGGLLEASPTRLVTWIQPQRSPWWMPVYYRDIAPPAIAVGTISSGVKSVAPTAISRISPGLKSAEPARAFVFDVSANTPKAFAAVALTPNGSSAVKAATAGGGLLVFGYSSNTTSIRNLAEGTFSTRQHKLRILDVTGTPALRAAIDIPGSLVAVTDLTADGFLAWTESRSVDTRKSASSRQVQVSACDGKDAFFVAGTELSGPGALAADGRNLFSVKGTSVVRYRLTDSRALVLQDFLDLGWTPDNLRTIPGGLLGGKWDRIFRATWSDAGSGDVADWETERSVTLSRAIPLADGSVFSPSGAYGVDVLKVEP
jgi:hypothetical protein